MDDLPNLLILKAFHYSLINTIGRFRSCEGLNVCSWSKFYPNIIIAGGYRGSVHVFHVNYLLSSMVIAHGHSSRISSIDWNPLIYSNSFLTTGVKIWHIREGSLMSDTYTNHKRIYSAIWKPDHTNIFACAGHGTLRTYDTHVPNFVNRVGFSENFSSCDWSKHNGNCIATADKFRNCISVWDVRYTGNPYWVDHIETESAKVINTDSTLWKVKLSPYQEGQIASCSKDSEVALWNYGVGEPAIQSYFHHVGPVFGFDMSIGSDFSTLMASTGWDGFVNVWERMEVVPNF